MHVPGNITLVLVLYNAALNKAISVVRIYTVQKFRDERGRKKERKGRKKKKGREIDSANSKRKISSSFNCCQQIFCH